MVTVPKLLMAQCMHAAMYSLSIVHKRSGVED